MWTGEPIVGVGGWRPDDGIPRHDSNSSLSNSQLAQSAGRLLRYTFISLSTTILDETIVLYVEPACEHVEGGRYVGPEFQMGQVYDGGPTTADTDVVLYRPVYVCVSTLRSHLKNSNNFAANCAKLTQQNSRERNNAAAALAAVAATSSSSAQQQQQPKSSWLCLCSIHLVIPSCWPMLCKMMYIFSTLFFIFLRPSIAPWKKKKSKCALGMGEISCCGLHPKVILPVGARWIDKHVHCVSSSQSFFLALTNIFWPKRLQIKKKRVGPGPALVSICNRITLALRSRSIQYTPTKHDTAMREEEEETNKQTNIF